MRRRGKSRTIPHVRLSKTTPLWILLGLAVLLPGCTSVPAQKAAPEPQTSAASTVLAEIALKRGDCKGASESYAKAAAAGTAVSLARRASEVAVACEHLPAAWQSVNRWRALAPGDREATALYAAVALKLYRMPEARSAILEFSHEKPAAGGTPPKDPPGLATLAALLLEHSDASAVLAAMGGALDSENPPPDTLALLGELSLDSFDSRRAQRYAEEALQRDGKDFAAMRVLARAYVMHGDPSKAIATARSAMTLDGTRGAFELAEIFTELDRLEEAHSELERLRNTSAPTAEIERRLALLAYDSGDLEEAGQRFSELASSDGDASDSSLLYLADIAARSGDPATALAGYRKLADSSVAIAARSRGAALLMARNDRAGALAMLDDYAASHPESEFELTLAKARLLADHGETDTGLSLLGSALERHPSHPSIEYDKAVILERAGRVHESVEVLEKLLTLRPDDPILTNALGYTLADHNLELPRAETLIQRALASSPDSPAILDSLGWVRYRQGDAQGAAPMLARAYSIQHDSEIGAHWGEVLWASGAHQEARRVWASALARDPSSESLKATLLRFIPDAAAPPPTTRQSPPKEPSKDFKDRRETR
jgi:tetratricopeptide (TPR) repeat protein